MTENKNKADDAGGGDAEVRDQKTCLICGSYTHLDHEGWLFWTRILPTVLVISAIFWVLASIF